MGEPVIRRAAAADLSELSRLWHEKRTVQQQFDRRLTLAPDGRRLWQRSAAAWLDDQRCAMMVGAGAGGLLGYAIGWVQPNPPGLLPESIGAITDIALDAHAYQGGLGRALVQALREWFRQQHITDVVAYVPYRQAVEQAFWRSLGAVEWIDILWLK
ncbi:MAG: GNAT family N-acetyltransferase [Chloroflexi bacterium]|nr:GNAT family N-acetyltransferase [Chloroflexota bacterium]